jgi:hypothetical protein
MASGGTWSDCGSLCRGKPAGTICAEVCVPQCECIANEKNCPQGYFCETGVASGEGICRSGTEPPTQPIVSAPVIKEFKSPDGMTSVRIEGTDNSGMAAPVLSDPFGFSGTSTAFESVIAWDVRQADGNIVASGNAHIGSQDVGIPGPFSVKGSFDKTPTTASGTLEVFEASAKDGSPIHEVMIPVILQTQKQEVNQGLIQP